MSGGKEREEERKRESALAISVGRETPVAYHKHIRGGFCYLLLSRYQHGVLSTPQGDGDNPQRRSQHW